MVEQQTPEERAETSARELADTDRAVTARAVLEAAGVRMTVPADVQGRLEAIWADAYRAALDTAAPERDRLQLEVEHLTKDAQAYITDLHEAEQTEQTLRHELDQANQRTTDAEAEARTAVEQAQHEVAEIRGRADQLAAENVRLTKLIEERLSKLTNDKQERH